MIFIAEIGLNHNGNIDLLSEMIKQAKYSGADIAKIQLGWRGKKEELNYINEPSIKKIIKWCEYYEIELMASIFNNEAYELVKKIKMDRYKIASRTVKDDIQLVEKIVKEGKETFISLGMWENNDNLPLNHSKNVKYLWCKSIYPASPWELTDLPKNFTSSRYDGYSDHSIGIDIPLLAIARGAEIIEKHFTLDKSDTTIRDHVLSASPDEFKDLTQIGRNINRNLKMGV
tara:strand:- start:80 stop:769 length:690 start_codon:yes stop_codon:yes gene_type:complete